MMVAHGLGFERTHNLVALSETLDRGWSELAGGRR